MSSAWRTPTSNMAPDNKMELDEDEDEPGLPPSNLDEHDNLLVNYYQLLPLLKGDPVSKEMIGAIIIEGFVTASAITKATTRQLVKIHGVTTEAANAIKKRISSTIKLTGFRSARLQHASLQNRKRLTTGSKGIDRVLNGGWEPFSVTEICGAPATCKTQLMHSSTITALLPEAEGGLNKNVIFIDTEHTFLPSRLEQIASRYNLDFASVKNRVIFSHATSTEHLYTLLVQTLAIIGSGAYGLVIIDSIAQLLTTEFNRGLSDLGERQRAVSKILSMCTRIAETGVILLITNGLRTNINNAGVCKDVSYNKVRLSKGKLGVRLFSLLKSSSLPFGQAMFTISKFNGISDVEKDEDISMT